MSVFGYAVRVDTAPSPRMIPHLVVRAGRVLFALPSAEIRRVMRNMTIYPVPGSGQHVLGLSRFGGEALVVYSLESLAGLQELPWGVSPTLLVLRKGNEEIGLAVREALEVVDLPEVEGEVPPAEEVGEFRRVVSRSSFERLFDPENLRKSVGDQPISGGG